MSKLVFSGGDKILEGCYAWCVYDDNHFVIKSELSNVPTGALVYHSGSLN